ncbi:MFS transporter [Promicromonospora thailandica]|uniref:MFS transporter, DHA1 family, L-arabinose/isopropyl-beta-D-thiogalactopyranoside export protein n=1 Tax=Promicromonospora thailandica TaxID=765201 RepID=A0A9X2G3I1_9MICO|nr:MFS transporter [Promicromonospora thailandica]MCP2265115.1 MFS transporter, DHA1 family, L-arabinose/isopropyl-beta-D-thiogalactopyranoside export protein [Promicromonospora thailandica]BFF19816.1 MFS transporter [Promicromonospora thailandica]
MTSNRPTAATEFAAAPVDQRRALVALVALSVSAFTFVTAENLPGGLLTLIAPDLGRSTSEIGLLVTAYAVVVVVASLPLTRLTRRFPRRWVLAATTAVCAVGSLWSALAVGYADLMAARMLTALGQALFWSIVTPAAASLFAPAVRGRMIARLAVGNSLAPLLGVPLGTWVGQQTGWRTAFLLFSVVSLLACVTMAVAMPHVDAEQSGTARGTHPNLRRFVLLLVVTVLLVTGGFTMITFVTQFLLETAGFADRYLSALLLVQGSAGLAGTLLIGQVLDKRPWHTIVVALAALTGALVLLGTLGHVPAVALAGLALFGLAFSAVPPALSFLSLRVAPGATESATAISSSVFNIGIGGGAALGALVVATTGIGTVPLVGAAFVLAALAVLVTDLWTTTRTAARRTTSRRP